MRFLEASLKVTQETIAIRKIKIIGVGQAKKVNTNETVNVVSYIRLWYIRWKIPPPSPNYSVRTKFKSQDRSESRAIKGSDDQPDDYEDLYVS